MNKLISFFVFLGILSIEAGTAYYSLHRSLGQTSNFDLFASALQEGRAKVLWVSYSAPLLSQKSQGTLESEKFEKIWLRPSISMVGQNFSGNTLSALFCQPADCNTLLLSKNLPLGSSPEKLSQTDALSLIQLPQQIPLQEEK